MVRMFERISSAPSWKSLQREALISNERRPNIGTRPRHILWGRSSNVRLGADSLDRQKVSNQPAVVRLEECPLR
jgi:hypothetical protein